MDPTQAAKIANMLFYYIANSTYEHFTGTIDPTTLKFSLNEMVKQLHLSEEQVKALLTPFEQSQFQAMRDF